MRQILLKALASGLIMSLFPYAAISAPPKPAHADSLLTLLPKTPDAAGRERIYVQLADLSGDSLELAAPYWEAALAEAHKAGDTYGCKDALDFLVRKFADRDARRAEKYIALADSILPGSRYALFRSSLYAYYLWKQMNDNNSIETVTRAVEELKGKNYDRLSPEERIEWEFLTGLAIDFSSVTTEAYDNIAKAIPYVERALENLRKYPLEERLHLEKICHDELSDLYMLCKDKRAEEQIGQCIDLHRKWLAMDDRFERPHRDTTGYMMRAYAKMVYLRDLISRDKLNEYYQKCIGLARARGDMAEIYSTSARYYQCTGDYERAVAYIDSTITVYKSKGIKADLAPIYATQSYLYEEMGDYKNALKAVRTTNNIRFNERVEEAQSSLAEMQTLFEVGRLEFEKSRLTGRIRFIALLAGGILIAGSFGCRFLWLLFHCRRCFFLFLLRLHRAVLFKAKGIIMDRSAFQLPDAGGKAVYKVSVMADKQQCAVKGLHCLLHPLPGGNVQVVGGLVQNEHIRRVEEDRRQGHPLALAAGEEQDELRDGRMFDDVQALEGYLESLSS